MKHFKMMLYGEPGVGKSVFAVGLPKPFFITTDGNYEWLEDFGGKPEDHVRVDTWKEAVNAINQSYDNYETIVIDLTEDLFKACEYDFCQSQKIDHVGDLGFAKGYDISRNNFFRECCKLINKDKNILFISHEVCITTKDRRGVEHSYYRPSNRIPDKVLDQLEGRLRFVVRCYYKTEEIDNKIIKKRMLSIVPKENEYGIIRGVNTNSFVEDIPLDPEVFLQTIDYASKKMVEEIKKEKKIIELNIPTNEVKIDKPVEVKEEKPVEVKVEKEEKLEVKPEPVEQPQVTVAKSITEDKMAKLKAQLEALKLAKGK